ncbi:hypothetical protein [Nocardia vaccinii]|uniref:hypothetical protein n=1 Tax=Nocardia vaccinii TaxID=1822 RepID=UPI0012F5162E|nr:hypothetical protein [Nocardia vaccinii]
MSLALSAVLGVLLVVHLGAMGYAVAHWRWSLPAVAAPVAAKLLLFGRLRTVGARRRGDAQMGTQKRLRRAREPVSKPSDRW